MYEALVARVRYHIQKANFMGLKEAESTLLLAETADAIELQQKLLDGLEADNDSLCETIDLYRKLLGGHPDPRGEDGEPGMKCIDCQCDCQMIGLDMPACTAYKSTKEET